MKKKKIGGIFPILGFIVFTVFTICIFVPMIWAWISTFRVTDEFDDNYFAFPQKWVLENYIYSFKVFKVKIDNVYIKFWGMLWNTFLYAGVGTLMYVICHYLVAYCTAKYPYKFSKILYTTVLVIMVIPIVGDSAARLQLLDALNMYDNWLGFFFQRFGFTGLYFLVMHETIKAVPNSISEAAEIDGANQFQIMWGIVFPQVINMVAVVALITFMGQWNEFQFAIMYMPSYPTLASGLQQFLRSGNNEIAGSIPMQLAGCMLLFYPMLILFIFLHDKMMGDLSMGGVKE